MKIVKLPKVLFSYQQLESSFPFSIGYSMLINVLPHVLCEKTVSTLTAIRTAVLENMPASVKAEGITDSYVTVQPNLTCELDEIEENGKRINSYFEQIGFKSEDLTYGDDNYVAKGQAIAAFAAGINSDEGILEFSTGDVIENPQEYVNMFLAEHKDLSDMQSVVRTFFANSPAATQFQITVDKCNHCNEHALRIVGRYYGLSFALVIPFAQD